MDDDVFFGIFVALILIGATIWLIGIVIELFIFTLPAWGSGAVSGIATYGALRLKIASDLHSYAKFSQFVDFGFDGFRLCSKLKREAVKNYVAPYNIVPVLLCILVTAIVFMAIVSEPSGLGREEKWFQISGLLFTAVITLCFALLLWIRIDLTSAVETQVRRALDQANTSFQASGELQEIIRDNALLAEELQINFPQDDVSVVRNYIDTHRIKVLTDPSSLHTVIAAEIEKAKRDQSDLRKAGERFDEVMQLQQNVSRTVFSTKSPSMVNAIDLLYDQIHIAKEVCLPQREWDTFEEAMSVYTQEIKELEKQALSLTAGERLDFNTGNPYQVLGVTPEMTDAEIKGVFRELCNIYHPDKGKVRDSEKFKEIKDAYDEIMKH